MFRFTFKFIFVIICSCPLETLLSWLFSCMWQFEQIPIGPISIVIIVFCYHVFLEIISMLKHDCIHQKNSYSSYTYMHQENQTIHESITHCQRNQALTSFGCVSKMQSWTNEPEISLPNKFDGTHSKFWGFVN
jgi:hypothetical protein